MSLKQCGEQTITDSKATYSRQAPVYSLLKVFSFRTFFGDLPHGLRYGRLSAKYLDSCLSSFSSRLTLLVGLPLHVQRLI